MDTEAILFDLDGTLWDAVAEICETWNGVLKRHPGIRGPISVEEQRGCMGLPMNRIAERLFPNLPEERRLALLAECCRDENVYLAAHGAALYPKVEETLRALSEKHRLMVVSNCQTGYIEAFLKAHKLGTYFCDMECFGKTGLSKGGNISRVIARNSIQSAVYVGDTQGDADAAAEAGIPFVYAAYGFGEAAEYAEKIDRFEALLRLFDGN